MQALSIVSESGLIRSVCLALLASLTIANTATAEKSSKHISPSQLAQPVADFELRDYRGKVHRLSDLKDKQLVVLAFLGTECPLAKLYGVRLEELRKRFEDMPVGFLGINSNQQDTLSELANYARKHKLTFPLLKDAGNQLADAISAERTPQVFLLDENRVVRYSGAIDDQYGIGVQRRSAKQTYLVTAIEQLLAGESVTLAQTNPIGCHIGRVNNSSPSGSITYTKHIAPILNSNCVECHREGEVAPFPLATYQDVLGWEEMIVEVIGENRMPPWHADPQHGEFKNDARLTEEEKSLIRSWAAGGSPEGDPADLPEPPQFAEGWRMPEPDQVIHMDEKPFAVQAEGVVDYQYFLVDPEWNEDKYVVAAEARPGNRSVVHHILAYVVPPGTDPKKDRPRTAVVGYAPGSAPNVLQEGTAIHVKAGSKLLFEMHYTPNGSEQKDLSYVGVSFTQRDKVKKFVHGRAAINHRFTIPPNAANHKVVAQHRTKQDELLLRLTPHMHLRGKSFRFEAIYPDETREVLLRVPAYDFNWQLSYELATPKLLPKGTRILCTAHFDNSADNPANPDPTAEVHWGEQSFNEMMIGFFDVVDADEQPADTKSAARAGQGALK